MRRKSGNRKKNSEECEAPALKFGEVPALHKYSYGHMHLFLRLVLEASASMRGASRSLDIVGSFLELGIEMPSWSAGRLWLLRIGLYKLERAKTIADDWIWIIDHTVQLGNEKCMVILGVRESSFPDCELHLKHEDVEPLALFPVEKSNGEVVFRQLDATIEKTGLPKQIVFDHGADVKGGAEKFCEKYRVIGTYDIKHKGATILKRELKDAPDWENFSVHRVFAGKGMSMVARPSWSGMHWFQNGGIFAIWDQSWKLWLPFPPPQIRDEPNRIRDRQVQEFAERPGKGRLHRNDPRSRRRGYRLRHGHDRRGDRLDSDKKGVGMGEE